MPSTSFAQWGVVFRGDGRIRSSGRLDAQDVAPKIYEEYIRACRMVGEEDPYASETTLGIHEVLMVHFLIADFFYAKGEGIGGIGIKSLDALHSALHRQHVALGGVEKWQTEYEICATLLFGLIKNHPFHDANKRTASLSSLYFLHEKNLMLKINHKNFENFIVEIAQPKFNQKYNKTGNAKDTDEEIKRIAKFLKNSTRSSDRRHYKITYRQLDKILKENGFYLGDKKGGKVDVMRYSGKKKRFFGLVEVTVPLKRVARIGFPGEARQVSRKDIKMVREATGLTEENGVDSQVFFKGVDPVDILEEHQNILRRLADR